MAGQRAVETVARDRWEGRVLAFPGDLVSLRPRRVAGGGNMAVVLSGARLSGPLPRTPECRVLCPVLNGSGAITGHMAICLPEEEPGDVMKWARPVFPRTWRLFWTVP